MTKRHFIPISIAACLLAVAYLSTHTESLDSSNREFDLKRSLKEDVGISAHAAQEVYILKRLARTDANAKSDLAAHYYVGSGVPEDHNRAAALFSEAAQARNSKAQLCLAVLLSKGEGFEQNDVEALKWLLIAQQSHDRYGKMASRLLERLSAEVPHEKQEIAESTARKWISEHTGSQEESTIVTNQEAQ